MERNNKVEEEMDHEDNAESDTNHGDSEEDLVGNGGVGCCDRNALIEGGHWVDGVGRGARKRRDGGQTV